MDFELSEEQVMLRDTTRDVLTKTYDVETVRKVTDSELGWNRDVWNSLAEIGILGLTIDEEDGGMGAGPVELSAVLGEIGRTLAPEPYLNGVVVPAALISDTADGPVRAELLGGLASGELLAAFAHTEAGDRWPYAAVATTASGDGEEVTLTGTKTEVLAGDSADKLVVSARNGTTCPETLSDIPASHPSTTGMASSRTGIGAAGTIPTSLMPTGAGRAKPRSLTLMRSAARRTVRTMRSVTAGSSGTTPSGPTRRICSPVPRSTASTAHCAGSTVIAGRAPTGGRP